MNGITNASLILIAAASAAFSAPPTVGKKAPDFTLSTPEGKQVRLSEVNSRAPVVLVVLRGYPGYQCPYCNRQVQDFINSAPGFSDAGFHVLLVYPGPPQDLNVKANDFLKGKPLPANFDLVVDPGYIFTNLYGLRWNADHETAYPSTFLIDSKGMIVFSKIVKEHGARTTAAEVLNAFPKRKPS